MVKNRPIVSTCLICLSLRVLLIKFNKIRFKSTRKIKCWFLKVLGPRQELFQLHLCKKLSQKLASKFKLLTSYKCRFSWKSREIWLLRRKSLLFWKEKNSTRRSLSRVWKLFNKKKSKRKDFRANIRIWKRTLKQPKLNMKKNWKSVYLKWKAYVKWSPKLSRKSSEEILKRDNNQIFRA